MKSKECVAMILAGGQGSRLGILTKNVAKPAVPFGGKYRIIDFPLSNCTHSGINTVGVLTQYQPLELNTYIGNGQPWDLDRNDGGVYVLPPYVSAEKGEWYKGTANAIYQNIAFIDSFEPKYVAVLSGDHIYKMDYSRMLKAHKKADAAATIAVIEVPWEEAPRFGIMNTAEDMTITEFEEKPKKPKSNLASMGVYIFTWSVLKKFLIADENNPKSANDFGKNIIPEMLASGHKMLAYRFDGYWKDVGTVASLWEANMDLLSDKPPFDLENDDWRIYSRNPAKPPHYIAPGAKIRNCYVTEGCEIEGSAENSILFNGVKIEKGAEVRDSIIMPNAHIACGAVLEKAVVGPGVYISENAVIGSKDADAADDFVNSRICTGDITLIGADVTVGAGIKVACGSMVTRNIKKNSKAEGAASKSATETA